MKMSKGQRGVIFGVLAAAVLMIIADVVVLHGFPFKQEPEVYELPVVDSSIPDYEPVLTTPVIQNPEEVAGPFRDLNVPPPDTEKYTVERTEPVMPAESKAEEPKPEELKVVIVKEPAPVRHEGEPAKIIVIIDDMGMDRKHSNQIVELPGPLTLAFLPYAPHLDTLTAAAKAKGDELMIHMPMEAMDKRQNPGPIAIKSGMSEDEMKSMLEKAFNSFTGYVGLNNHMGSRMTKDEKAMRLVMAELKKRDLFFVDSKTIGSSVAEQMASEAGIRHAERDVFLDNDNTTENVRRELHVLERIADKKGYAIAIGHPREATVQVLKEWLPTLKGRGFELVPVSTVTRKSKIVSAPEEETPAAGTESVAVTPSLPSFDSYYGPPRPPAPLPVTLPVPY
jgi:hypothetical protein